MFASPDNDSLHSHKSVGPRRVQYSVLGRLGYDANFLKIEVHKICTTSLKSLEPKTVQKTWLADKQHFGQKAFSTKVFSAIYAVR